MFSLKRWLHALWPLLSWIVGIQRELGDVFYAVDALWQDSEISFAQVIEHAAAKKKRIPKYLHHNKD